MKRIFAVLMFLFIMAGGSAFAGEAEDRGLKSDVVVFFTSDVHCGVDQGFTYTGLKAVVDAEMAAGSHVLLVDNGDSAQGEAIGLLTKGMASVELMNAMGYDIAIPGNHEFDYGMDSFLRMTEAAQFPYISCNIHKNGELLLKPYVIREIDGVKLAFVGATAPETLTLSPPTTFQDEEGNFIYDFSQAGSGKALYEAVQAAVDSAREEGADYVFLMAHLGNAAASSPYNYVDVVSHTTGIDAVLDGHSHDTDKAVMKNSKGDTVLRQACGTKLEGIGWLRISAADGSLETGLYTWTNEKSLPELLGLKNEITPVMEKIVSEVNDSLSSVIGRSSVKLTIEDPQAVDSDNVPLPIVRRTETNIGDFSADAHRMVLEADIGVVNAGSIRASVPVGDLTTSDLLKVFPYGNKCIVIEATGRQILDALEWGARLMPESNAAFLLVSGLTYEVHTGIDSSCTLDEYGMFTGVEGEYRVKNVMVGEEPLDPEKIYTVAGPEFIFVAHGDGHTSFDGAKILRDDNILSHEVIRRYIGEVLGGVVGPGYENPYGEGRIVAVEEEP